MACLDSAKERIVLVARTLVITERWFLNPKVRKSLSDVLCEKFLLNCACWLTCFFQPKSFHKISLCLFYFLSWITVTKLVNGYSTNDLATVTHDNGTWMFIFKLLLLPVRNIGKDFRYPLWFPCLLSNLFHPKNTWHMTSYAVSAAFFELQSVL